MKMHVLFVKDIEGMVVVSRHNTLQTTHQMDFSVRVLTNVSFPEFHSEQGQPLCKTSVVSVSIVIFATLQRMILVLLCTTGDCVFISDVHSPKLRRAGPCEEFYG